jgi:cyclopropane fatty-acyl-phospholipid synthase-like methyltransferase
LENQKKKEFRHSLDLTSDELEMYIPSVLKGLWELGSMPEYMIELIGRNGPVKGKTVIDLGCGKGAVLVKLAAHFEIRAMGIDILPEFIKEATKYAGKYGVSGKILFKVEDITETVKTTSEQDIVIYGYDSEILGDLDATLRQLAKCIKDDGRILLEYMYADHQTEGMQTAGEMIESIERSGFHILDSIDWNGETLKQINRQNTDIIRMNVEGLISRYPHKKEMFSEYLQNQIEECEKSETEYSCTTLLLVRKDFIDLSPLLT